MNIEIDLKKTGEISDIIHSHKAGSWDVTKIHLSDGVYCEVSPYCRLTSLKSEFTRKTAAYWSIGRAMHGVMEENFESTEVERTFGPAVSHIDVIYETQPIEFKTTRKRIKSYTDIPDVWIKQVKLECVFTNSKVGWLVILEIIPALITVWKLDLTYDDLSRTGSTYLEYIERLQAAIEDKNPHLLEPLRWQCKGCTYRNNCPRRPGL